MRINPYFEINGNTYEIKRTRHLMVVYEQLGESNQMSDEDKANAVKLQVLIDKVQKFANKLQEIEKEYFNDMANEGLEKQYNACDKMYQKAVQEMADFEIKNGSTSKLQKAGIDLLEKVVIEGIVEQYSLTKTDATKLWESFVDKVGKRVASEWLGGMAQCLFGNDEEEEDNPFLAQMRKQNKKLKK